MDLGNPYPGRIERGWRAHSCRPSCNYNTETGTIDADVIDHCINCCLIRMTEGEAVVEDLIGIIDCGLSFFGHGNAAGRDDWESGEYNSEDGVRICWTAQTLSGTTGSPSTITFVFSGADEECDITFSSQDDVNSQLASLGKKELYNRFFKKDKPRKTVRVFGTTFNLDLDVNFGTAFLLLLDEDQKMYHLVFEDYNEIRIFKEIAGAYHECATVDSVEDLRRFVMNPVRP